MGEERKIKHFAAISLIEFVVWQCLWLKLAKSIILSLLAFFANILLLVVFRIWQLCESNKQNRIFPGHIQMELHLHSNCILSFVLLFGLVNLILPTDTVVERITSRIILLWSIVQSLNNRKWNMRTNTDEQTQTEALNQILCDVITVNYLPRWYGQDWCLQQFTINKKNRTNFGKSCPLYHLRAQ